MGGVKGLIFGGNLFVFLAPPRHPAVRWPVSVCIHYGIHDMQRVTIREDAAMSRLLFVTEPGVDVARF